MRTWRLAVIALMLTASASAVHARQAWKTVSQSGDRFKIEGPGAVQTNPAHPGHYLWSLGNSSFIVEVDALDDVMQDAMVKRNVKMVTTYLETMRKTTVAEMKGTLQGGSNVGFDSGFPALLFAFTGEIEGKPYAASQRIVLDDTRMYSLIAIGRKSEIKQADIDRFLGSFDILPPPAPSGAWQKATFTAAVCGKIPPVPIAFEMPAGFEGRPAGGRTNTEAGCLWGVKADLDHVTADPSQGDFTNLKSGVFRLRMSTNVVMDPQTNVFDGMDGSGEAGMRRSYEQAGARIGVFKKATIAGLPALQIVADVSGSRVYMLYLGNTKYISNTMLINYYPPAKRSSADDDVWAHFVAAVTAAK